MGSDPQAESRAPGSVWLASLVLVLLFLPRASAQTTPCWVSTFGGVQDEEAWGSALTPDGGLAVTGWTQSYGGVSCAAWALKLREDGSVEWQKTYARSFEVGSYLEPTADGGFAMAGYTKVPAGSLDFWLLKLRGDGNVTWQKTYGGSKDDTASGVRQTSDGGYVMAGETESFGSGGWDVWVLRLDEGGNVVWQKAYGGKGTETSSAEPIVPTWDGGFAVCGRTESFGAGQGDFFVLKLDANGAIQWQKAYGGSGYEYAHSIKQTPDGGYVVAGNTNSYGAGGDDFWVVKLSATGAIQWQKAYGGAGDDDAWSIQTARGDGYVVAGGSESFGGGTRSVWVLKLAENGAVQWQKAVGGTGSDVACSCRTTGDGGYTVAGGATSYGAGKLDYFVLKLDHAGAVFGCTIVSDTHATVTSTGAVATNAAAVARDSQAIVTRTTVVPHDTTASVHTQCFGEGEVVHVPRRHLGRSGE